ncbi:MAG TPA: MFS transporter [Solirubrobacteraceae bacterium]
MGARVEVVEEQPARLTRDRNFALLWVGEVLSDTGSQVTATAMPLLVLYLTGSAADAGLIGVAGSIAYPVAALPAGVLADRLDRRRLMMASALLRLVAIASVPIAFAFGRPTLAQLVVVALANATLFSVAAVAERGLVGEIVPAPAYPEAVTLNEARSAVAVTAGPPLGGVLFAVSRGLPFVADSASFLAVFVALLALRIPRRRPAAARESRAMSLAGVVHEVIEGARWLLGQPFLRAGAVLYAALNVSIAALRLLGLLIAHRHGASAAAIGAMFAIVGAGGVLGAVIAGPLRRRLSARWAVLAEPWSDAVFMPLLLVVHSAWAIGVLVGVMLLPMTLSTAVIAGGRLALTPDRLRGRVQASSMLVSSSIAWVGPLAIGLLFQYVGETASVLALAGWALAVAVVATAAPALGYDAAPSSGSSRSGADR